MAWDSIKMAQQFLQRANALHPEEDPDTYAVVLAKQELYYECYMTAFSRMEIVKMLQKAIAGDIKLPKDVDVSEYRTAYAQEAEKIMASLPD